MNKTLIVETKEPLCPFGFVLNFEHSDFDIVSDFGFRYSDLSYDLRLSETKHIAKIGDITSGTTHYEGRTQRAVCIIVLEWKATIRCR